MTHTLCIDIGGTSIKAAVFDAAGAQVRSARRRTPYPCPPQRLLERLGQIATATAPFDRVAIGFPGLIRNGRVRHVTALTRAAYDGEPVAELVAQWSGFDLLTAAQQQLGAPVRIANDADVQGSAVISGRGVEFVMTLGTGVGTALFVDGALVPHLELSHAPFEDQRTFDTALGNARRREIGNDPWAADVLRAIAAFDRVVHFDDCLIGGGNAVLLDPARLPARCRVVSNAAGLRGGLRLWRDAASTTPTAPRVN